MTKSVSNSIWISLYGHECLHWIVVSLQIRFRNHSTWQWQAACPPPTQSPDRLFQRVDDIRWAYIDIIVRSSQTSTNQTSSDVSLVRGDFLKMLLHVNVPPTIGWYAYRHIAIQPLWYLQTHSSPFVFAVALTMLPFNTWVRQYPSWLIIAIPGEWPFSWGLSETPRPTTHCSNLSLPVHLYAYESTI